MYNFPDAIPEQVLIIAEIGNNHEGNLEVAHQLIEQAAEAGADAVKFQTFQTSHYVSPSNSERFARLKSFELSESDFRALAEHAMAKDLLFLSTPFDLQSAAFLNTLVPGFKISSGDNTFWPLIDQIAHYQKPILLSTGLASLSEIALAKARIEAIWSAANCQQSLILLHCVSAYPVPANEAALHKVKQLKQYFPGCLIGYSDHTLGNQAALEAINLGARVIEKHFTLAHNYSDFRDHQLSATPTELKALVTAVRNLECLYKNQHWTQPSETSNISQMRRHIAASRDLPMGHVLQWEDITWIRPQGEFAPGQENLLLGKRLARALSAGSPITRTVLHP